MDLDEWELLPHHDHGFLDYHEDGSKAYGSDKRTSPSSKTMFNMNYFMCPSSPPRHSTRVMPGQLVPVRFQLEPKTTTGKEVPEDETTGKEVREDGFSKEVVTKVPMDITVVPPKTIPRVKAASPNNILGSKEADQDSVSQVFFKKMKENEFVDMKLDSPKSSTAAAAAAAATTTNNKGGFVPPPPIDAAGATLNCDQACKGEALMDQAMITSPRIRISEMENRKEEVSWDHDENNGGLNLWKLSLTGIGAICSFGVAAATICIIIFGSHQKNKQQQQQNQNLRFQIYSDDKRIKQVVHQATKLNEAISAARGVPIARAHITYGGYYDGL